MTVPTPTTATNNAPRPRCLLLQTAIGDYRDEFVRQASAALDLEIVAGADYFDPSVRTDFERMPSIEVCSNRFLLGRRLLVQTGAFRRALGAEVLVAEGNPRIASTWLLVAIRRVLRRPTVLWAHAWSRRGSGSWTNHLRLAMFRLSNATLVYTAAQRDELAAALRRPDRIFVAANSIYPARLMVAAHSTRRTTFVFSGRLVPAKRAALLVDAFVASHRLPTEAELVIVGDGPDEPALRESTRANPRVRWLGRVTDPEALAAIYGTGVVAVSPGYAGLSVTQALGFGVPLLVADDEPHAPEIDLVSEGVNGRFFKARDVESLTGGLERFWQERSDWAARADVISSDTRAGYSVEAMVEGFVESVLFAARRYRP